MVMPNDCPEPLVVFHVERNTEDGTTYTNGTTSTQRYNLVCDYSDNRNELHNWFVSEGYVDITNTHQTANRIRYRQSIPMPLRRKPDTGVDERLCYDAESHTLTFSVVTVIESLDSLSVDWTIAIPVYSIADLNKDGSVDGADLGLLLERWGTPDDLDGSGEMNGYDLGIWCSEWTG